MAITALSESFDNGVGTISNAWNVDTSVKGEVKLAGPSAMMQWATGREAGHGYGTYTVTAKIEGNEPGAGIVLWPGDNKWPGQEIDMAEVAPDGSGRHYGTVHWNDNGHDAYNVVMFDDVYSGTFHDYQMIWEPGKITFKVDGVEKGVITDHVPADYEHGGMNNTIGFLNNSPNTSITVSHVEFTPLGGSAPDREDTSTTEPDSSADSTSAVVSASAGQSASVDWNEIARQLLDHHQATGSWDLGSSASAAPAPAAAPAVSAAVDWNQLAAQVHENYTTHGGWFLA